MTLHWQEAERTRLNKELRKSQIIQEQLEKEKVSEVGEVESGNCLFGKTVQIFLMLQDEMEARFCDTVDKLEKDNKRLGELAAENQHDLNRMKVSNEQQIQNLGK